MPWRACNGEELRRRNYDFCKKERIFRYADDIERFLSDPGVAAPMVTYTWTTTSEGFGPHVSAPSSATFEAPLSDVLAGVIPQSDISNIELTYPGLSFDSAATSSIGFDFAAFVNPVTGAFIFHDDT